MGAKKKSPSKKPAASKAKATSKKAVKKALAKKPAAKKPAAKAKPSSVAKTLKKLVKKVTSALKVKPKAKPAAKKKAAAKPVKKAPAKKPAAKATPKKVAVKKPAVKTSAAKPSKKAAAKAVSAVAKKAGKKGDNNQPGKNSYSDAELQEFKTLIEQKIQAARDELRYLQEQINRTAAVGDTEADTTFSGLEDGTGTMEREYLNQMASRQITYIGHLEKALGRIANKSYGICRETGNLIPKDRLRAVPHATLSIEAKMAKDQ
jgi:RNA polymerase-binding transcription factor DksA